ncbi:MAG: orotidine-5'-phosphate decarboxylase [Candidatus Brocadiia bacterium]|nr:orotidine-5'-phosphate decarboxylase [Candidatus Brocadiia bacterium]
MQTFEERLLEAATRNRSLLCVGLDPDPALMPIPDVLAFTKGIVDATRDLVCAYKPNVAFYDAMGEAGHGPLRDIIRYIRDTGGVPIIGDAKRGDVGSTASAYARAMFEVLGFDATTVNPYGGRDAVQPFLDYADRGVFVWCRSSNPGARELQDLTVVSPYGGEPRPYYQLVAMQSASWNESGNVALVVGATYPDELRAVRELCPDMPILMPGVGAQGGALERAVEAGVDGRGRNLIVAASRSVLYASRDPEGYGAAARAEAESLRGGINAVLEARGLGWVE